MTNYKRTTYDSMYNFMTFVFILVCTGLIVSFVGKVLLGY